MVKRNIPENLAYDLSKETFPDSKINRNAISQFKKKNLFLRKLEQTLLVFFVAVLYLLLTAPLIQLGFAPLPRRSLDGLSAPEHPPRLSFSGFLKEKFQSKAEEWFLKRHGLWGYLVRANNEIIYRLFNQVSGNYDSTVLVGRDQQLFQPMFLRSYNKVDVPKMAAIEKRARQLKRFQDLLKDRGIASTLLFSTNVLSLYPELIPESYTDPTREQRENSYELMLPLLDQYGINYVDGHQLLTELKTTYPFRLFQSTGSHWNDPAACQVTKVLTIQLGSLLGKALNPIDCGSLYYLPAPELDDRDLLAIANLFFPEGTYRKTPYIQPVVQRTKQHFQPKLLFVGTSFSFAVLKQLKNFQITDQAKLYFYYRHVRDISGKTSILSRERIDWEKHVFSNDAIILEANTAGAGVAGFSFLTDALKHLKKTGKTLRKRKMKKDTRKLQDLPYFSN